MSGLLNKNVSPKTRHRWTSVGYVDIMLSATCSLYPTGSLHTRVMDDNSGVTFTPCMMHACAKPQFPTIVSGPYYVLRPVTNINAQINLTKKNLLWISCLYIKKENIKKKKFKASKLLTKYPTTPNQLISTFYTYMCFAYIHFSLARKEMDLSFAKERYLSPLIPKMRTLCMLGNLATTRTITASVLRNSHGCL